MRLIFMMPVLILLIPVFLFSETWKTYTTADGLADPVVRTLVVDPATGSKWFGTENGLTRFDGVKWTTYRKDTLKKQTLAGNRIFDMAYEVGYGPELWIGTNSGVSVMGIKPDAVSFATPYTKATRPLVSDLVQAVMVDSLGIKWFGTDKGISLFNSTSWDTVGEYDLSNVDVLALGYDANTDTTYVGTRGGGVSRVSVPAWDAITSASPYESLWSSMPSDTAHAVFIEKNGWQWFGTTAGLGYHQGTKTKENWTYFTKDGGLSGNRIACVFRDRRGLLWVGTHDGLSSFDGVNWNTHKKPNGPGGDVVYDIAQDKDGSLWFATNAGVSHLTDISGVGGKTADAALPETCSLGANYPNPFNPSTTIPFSLSEPAAVAMDVIDCYGRKVRTIAEGRFEPGSHVAAWSGRTIRELDAPTGVYMVVLRAHGRDWSEIKTTKIVLMR